MSIPSKATGAGNNSTARNVFKITFSQATSDAPKLEAWDNYSFNSVAHEIFVGTTGNGSKPMLSAVATTDGAPSSAWKPSSASGGGATINRLKGSTSYLNLAGAAVGAGGSVLFNLCWEIPYDAAIPANLDSVLVVRFNYAGVAPILTWSFNDSSAGGTEGSPVWTTITPGISGHVIRPGDAGSTGSNVVVHRPVSGTVDAPEVWVTTG